MKEQKHLMIIAGEPSGDLHGANLIKALISREPSLTITGIGGELMAREGMRHFFHIRELSVMGVTEVLMQFKKIKAAFDLFRRKIAKEKPDLLILIDYPGFNLKAAACAKQRSIPVLYYITPKVWAWNRSRLEKIRKYVDHAALIFPFEEALFKKENIPATFVGHPLLDCYSYSFFEKTEPKKRIPSIHPFVIGLLPGSRESEISNLLETMLKSARLIYANISQNLLHGDKNLTHQGSKIATYTDKEGSIKFPITFLVSAASSINIQRFNKIVNQYNHDGLFEIILGEPAELFRRCDLLIAASGTVTLEAAIFGIPMVIVYKTSFLTYLLAKIFVKIPYVGLPNIIARYPILPELLQSNATPERISQQILSMVDAKTLSTMKKQLNMIPRYLGGTGASSRTAQIAIQMMKR